jgi:predicted NodU family carbamoyl transferase
MGAPPRDRKHEDKSLDPFYCDVAASIQKVTEEILLKMATYLQRETGLKKLCIAGGVGSTASRTTSCCGARPFEEIYIHPRRATTAGAVGAALWGYHEPARPAEDAPALDHAYLGSEYGNAEIETFLKDNDIPLRAHRGRPTASTRASRRSSRRQGGRLVPRPLRVGPARARRALDHRRPRPQGHEGGRSTRRSSSARRSGPSRRR